MQAVVSCLAGEYVDGIYRIHDLGHTEAEKMTRICVQAGFRVQCYITRLRWCFYRHTCTFSSETKA